MNREEKSMIKFNALIPEISVKNIEKSKEFYISILGFKLEYERVFDKFIFLSFGEAQLMIEEINGHWSVGEISYPFGNGVNFQIYAENIDDIYKECKRKKLNFFRDMMVNEYKIDNQIVTEKEFLIQDPDGYLIRFQKDITS